jgi:hypothetical protein
LGAFLGFLQALQLFGFDWNVAFSGNVWQFHSTLQQDHGVNLPTEQAHNCTKPFFSQEAQKLSHVAMV